MAYVIQLLKNLYETFGEPYPRASMVVVFILGGLIFPADGSSLPSKSKRNIKHRMLQLARLLQV